MAKTDQNERDTLEPSAGCVAVPADQRLAGEDRSETLTNIVETAAAKAEQDYVTIGDMVTPDHTAHFSPLLLLPAIALVSPLSGIPLFSTVMGAIIFLVSLQMVAGRAHIWLPKWLLTLRTKGRYAKGALTQLKPTSRWLENRTSRRWAILTRKPLVVVPQVLCLLSGLLLPFLEFVPFSSSLVGLAVALLALGMMARDGVILVIGYIPYILIGGLITGMTT